MNNNTNITVHACRTRDEQRRFWQYLRDYFARDIRPGEPDPCPEAYRQTMQALHDRAEHPVCYLLFLRGGREIGLALSVVYAKEDGKQFILEFCVFPEFRGNGTGHACAGALLSWGRANGGKFAELNADAENRRRFWARLGFVPNGCDKWGEPLMLLPPQETVPFTVGRVTDPEALAGLEAGFLAEIGEPPMDEEKSARLHSAIHAGEIAFFAAKRLNRLIGMCSVSSCFSTFACKRLGVFDDFFVEPAFRHQGAARLLVQAAQSFCRAQGYAGLTVGCAGCDAPMYRALGFETTLGVMLASDF